MTAPETMVTSAGTRHLVGWPVSGANWFRPSCGYHLYLFPADQDEPHRNDCSRCFPQVDPALESARSIAAKLEAENAELTALVQRVADGHMVRCTDAIALLVRLNPTGDQS